jgi:uncharacterized protein YgfB (UPF0149 family)
MAVGLVCGGRAATDPLWRDILHADLELEEHLPPVLLTHMLHLPNGVQAALDDPDLCFDPMVRDDPHPLVTQAQDLRDWSDGFLYGFGLSGQAAMDALGEEAREAIADLTSCSRVDVAGIEEGEQDAAALTELREYLRVATLAIYFDSRPDPRTATPPAART